MAARRTHRNKLPSSLERRLAEKLALANRLRERSRRSSIDWERAAKLYTREGMTYSDVARAFGVDPGTIRDGLVACGIPKRPIGIQNTAPHGKRLYHVWQGMRQRCNNPGAARYEYYGDKGIRICREWDSFEAFYEWAMRSGSRSGLVLSRIRRDRNYSPSNCEWVTRTEASTRTARRNGWSKPHWTITAFGETKGPTAWLEDPRCRVSMPCLTQRIHAGMNPERALTEPGLTTKGASRNPITAFGETKSLNAWVDDPRCSVSANSVFRRLRRGFPPEVAISAPRRTC